MKIATNESCLPHYRMGDPRQSTGWRHAISIQEQQNIATCLGRTREQFLATAPYRRQHGCAQPSRDGHGFIIATAVRDNNFMRSVLAGKRFQQFADALSFIQCGNDDGNHGIHPARSK